MPRWDLEHILLFWVSLLFEDNLEPKHLSTLVDGKARRGGSEESLLSSPSMLKHFSGDIHIFIWLCFPSFWFGVLDFETWWGEDAAKKRL